MREMLSSGTVRPSVVEFPPRLGLGEEVGRVAAVDDDVSVTGPMRERHYDTAAAVPGWRWGADGLSEDVRDWSIQPQGFLEPGLAVVSDVDVDASP